MRLALYQIVSRILKHRPSLRYLYGTIFVILHGINASALELLPLKQIDNLTFSDQLQELKKRLTVDEWLGAQKSSRNSLALKLKHHAKKINSLEGEVVAEFILLLELDLNLYKSRLIAQRTIENIDTKIQALGRFYKSRLLIAKSDLALSQHKPKEAISMLKAAKESYKDEPYNIQSLIINQKLTDLLIDADEIDLAESLLKESQIIIEKSQLVNTLGRNYLLQGKLHNRINDQDLSLDYFYKAINEYKKSNNTQGHVESLLHICNVLEASKDFKLALVKCFKALELCEKSSLDLHWQSKILSKLSTVYSKSNNQEQAIKWINKAILINDTNLRYSDLLLSKIKLFRILNQSGDLTKSQATLKDIKRIEAAYWSQKAHFLFKKASFEYHILKRDFQVAKKLFAELVDLKSDSEGLEDIISVYRLAIESYQKIGFYEEVLTYQEFYHKANIENLKKILSKRLFFEQNRILNRKNEIRKQDLVIQKKEADNLRTAIIFTISLLIMIAASIKIYIYQSKKARQQRVDLKIRLKGLIDQMKLHFLFNSLYSIKYYFESSVEKACDAIDMSASLYRNILKANDLIVWPLATELELIDDFLGLQRLRFEDNLVYNLEAEGIDTNEIQFPCMLLQTIVENSIKYCSPSQKEGVSIFIKVNQHNNGYQFTVEDLGHHEQNKSIGSGTGLRNSKERLFKMYGQKSNFRTDFSKQGSSVSFWISRNVDGIDRETHN